MVTDGRKLRGQRRRAEIIDAALRVVRRDGAAGISHRTVAREAGVPASLTAYYFQTLDDLLVAALSTVTESYSERIREIIDGGGDGIRGLAELIAESAGPGRERALAERELSTLAARRPILRELARGWRDNVAELARGFTSDADAIDAFVAASDGLCTAILLDDGRPDVEHIRAVLAHTLARGTTTDSRHDRRAT
ncbi:TetR/AcrR family transcriptional regulator [Mycobacterium deserti]|uniref:TetR family transcriptional regulator n=1 Tax=Mycobacterium deserti TaxID=2978347 RepID=A0ABT2M856_9MYCO|nr:TetR family transcriptional regulator [Mycobacterium deserti]MCT7658448.1 TetR family transcriptional regulator [Mycobacterium deserti]